MAVIKWLIKVHLFGHLIVFALLLAGMRSTDLSFILMFIFLLFNALSCIGGVILLIYLCRTGQLVISKRVFFLLPHIMLYGLLHNAFSPFTWLNDSFMNVFPNVFFIIFEFGLPFLLYCFLQVTEGYRAVAAKILCFILPALIIMELIFTARQ
jgi:hypothetical protein